LQQHYEQNVEQLAAIKLDVILVRDRITTNREGMCSHMKFLLIHLELHKVANNKKQIKQKLEKAKAAACQSERVLWNTHKQVPFCILSILNVSAFAGKNEIEESFGCC